MDVKAFKLKSGEEIVAELVSLDGTEDNWRYTINNPLSPSPAGLTEWFGLSECRTFELYDTDLLFPPFEAHPTLVDLYEEKFGAIIVPPKPSLIVS